MPNRYEREIEEILRNLEHTDPKQGLGQKFGKHIHRDPAPRGAKRERRTIVPHFTAVEWLLCSAVLCALVAGGFAYTLLQQQGNLFTGIVAIVGFACMVLVAVLQFVIVPRRPRSVSYGNVTITPIRRGFWGTIKTRWNLFWMKMRYRRKDDTH
jgi:hypothetical protein